MDAKNLTKIIKNPKVIISVSIFGVLFYNFYTRYIYCNDLETYVVVCNAYETSERVRQRTMQMIELEPDLLSEIEMPDRPEYPEKSCRCAKKYG